MTRTEAAKIVAKEWTVYAVKWTLTAILVGGVGGGLLSAYGFYLWFALGWVGPVARWIVDVNTGAAEPILAMLAIELVIIVAALPFGLLIAVMNFFEAVDNVRDRNQEIDV